jgi:hypothetical protein
MTPSIVKEIIRQDPNAKLMITDGISYKSVEALMAFGMKTCESCGNILPLEKNFCKCGEEVFVILPKTYEAPAPLAKTPAAPQAKYDVNFWTPQEEMQIMAEANSKYTYELIAQIHNRSVKACREKVKRLRKKVNAI